MLNLEQIETGDECIIIKVHGHGEFRHRIIELGFVRGQSVKVIKNAPMRDPIEYQVMDSRISLRRSEARQIEVMTLSEFNSKNRQVSFNGTLKIECNDCDPDPSTTINVALVGNPNCGKTTLFNRLTGSHEKTGNYAGVTVGKKTGTIQRSGYTINIIDLPGTYSITEYTKEEVYVREYITNNHPDVILNIVDASNLERNLFLTTQLIDMSIKTVMSLNMHDELAKSGATLDHTTLSTMLGFPIIPTVASKGEGLDDILDAVISSFEERTKNRHIHINYGTIIENAIQNIERELDLNSDIAAKYHTRYLSIKLLETNLPTSDVIQTPVREEDKNDRNSFSNTRLEKIISTERFNLEREYKDDTRTIITSAKYGFIRGALTETLKRKRNNRLEASSEIDGILTNRIFGIPILLAFIWLMFQATFSLGAYPAEWIEIGVGHFGELCSSLIPAGILHDLVVDGIIAGVGSVIVFLPNIVILFLFMAFMDESGYMARAAFIMDKMMHNIGLHGKSFIPLLMGFGCNVPAIMATRTLVSRKDRIMTMLLVPFMSCSARLPVFILLISVFFEKNQGLVLLSIYFIGIVMAILTALVLHKSMKVKEEDPFVMELPPYRLPSARTTIRLAWDKVSQYLRKMGTTILAFSVIIWALGYFPMQDESVSSSQQLEQSYIGRIGRIIEPAIRPLGFDWKMGIGIISGIGAKEVVVSTLGVLYGEETAHLSEDELIESSTMKNNLLNDKYENGERIFSPLIAYSLMIFILLYVPCAAVVIAISKEGGRKWATISVIMSFAMAWIASYLITNIGGLF